MIEAPAPCSCGVVSWQAARFWGLLDMLRLRAGPLYGIAQLLEGSRNAATLRGHLKSTLEKSTTFEIKNGAPTQTDFRSQLGLVHRLCSAQGLPQTAALALHNSEEYENRELTAGEIAAVLDNVSFTLSKELDEQYFVRIASDKHAYIDQEH